MDEVTRRGVAYLNQYREAQRREAALRQEIERLRSLAESTTRALSPVPGASVDRLAETIERIIELQAQLASEVEDCVSIRAQVAAAIDQIDAANIRMVLRGRYLALRTIPDLCADEYYSPRQIIRLSQRGAAQVGAQCHVDTWYDDNIKNI